MRDRAVGVAAQQPAGAGVLDEVGLPVLEPYFVEESENHTVPSAAIAALLQTTIRTPSTLSATASTAAGAGVDAEQPAVRVADQQPPVEIDLDAERAAGGLGDPVDLGAVGADPPDRAVLGAGEDRPLVRAVGRDDDVLGAGAGHGDDGDGLAAHPVMLA